MYRVDVAPWNTDPAHPYGSSVHAVVSKEEAIIHMSWVRTEAQMREKSVTSGYASSRDWSKDLDRWRWRARHPRWTMLGAPLARNPTARFRVTQLPEFLKAMP
jgi:hypothetical protein